MNTSLILIIITTALVNNVVLSQFLGICSFLGVSKQIKTSLSLGVAVIFVITLSSGVASLAVRFPAGSAAPGISGNHCLYSRHCSSSYRSLRCS